MEQVIRRFNIITLRPHWAQYIISHGLKFLVSMVLLLVAGHGAITFKAPFLILGTITTLMMLYGCLYLCKLRFIVSSEQLIIQHGIFHRTSDYIELYRIVDFSESRDILEQLVRAKDRQYLQRRQNQSKARHLRSERKARRGGYHQRKS